MALTGRRPLQRTCRIEWNYLGTGFALKTGKSEMSPFTVGTDFLARKAFPALGVDFLGLGKSIYSVRDKPGFGPRQASFVCLGRISPGLVRIFGGLLCLSRNDFPGLGANFRGPPLFV